MNKKVLSKFLLLIFVIAFILIPIKVNAATFDGVTDIYDSTYIVPYGQEIGIVYDKDETITSDNTDICKIDNSGKLQISGVGKFTITSQIGDNKNILNFFAWNVHLREGGYTVYSDEKKQNDSGKTEAKIYFAVSETSSSDTLKIEEALITTGKYTGGDLTGKYITSYYDKENDISLSRFYEYALDNKFEEDDDGSHGDQPTAPGDEDPDVIKIKLGKTYTPQTNETLNWNVVNEDILKIEDKAKGTVRAIRVGKTELIGKTNDGTKKVEVKLSVYREQGQIIKVEKIVLDKTKLEIKKDQKELITATVVPNYADNRKVSWVSSNNSVASVTIRGKVIANSTGSATITASTANGAKATCNVTVVGNVVQASEFDQRNKAVREYFADSSRNISSIFKKYCKGSNKIRGDQPLVYSTKLTSQNVRISLYDQSTGAKSDTKVVNKDNISYYMIPGNTYYIESETQDKVECVKVVGAKRMIYTPKAYNVRDLGGMNADNGTLKYGKVFRGANPNNTKNENAFKCLDIKKIVDLRSDSDFRKASSYFKFCEKVNNPPGYYLHSGNPRNAMRSIMKGVVENKNVFFHCAVGTDRTGTVAYLIEGILGVPLGERLDDYELSYFYRETSGHGTTRKKVRDGSLYKKVNQYSSNSKEQEKFMNWYLDGLSNKESELTLINNFRKAMINGNPTIYTLSNGKVKAQ